MAEANRICRKCGTNFIAIPGAEEPPDCPECVKTEIEKLEDTTFGRTTPPESPAPKKPVSS